MFLTKCDDGRDMLSKSFGPIFTVEVMGNRLRRWAIKMGERWEEEEGEVAFGRGVT